jgi:hypothetical protein
MQALVKRYEGQAFAILGINTDKDKDDYREKCIELGVTWRSSWQGKEKEICKLWGVRAYPTIYVLDAEGRIRYKNPRGAELERVVGILMEEMVVGMVDENYEDAIPGLMYERELADQDWASILEPLSASLDGGPTLEILDAPLEDKGEGDIDANEETALAALLASHAAAEAEWDKGWRELKGRERRDFRKNNPAAKFLEDFQTAADSGNGRAKLWLVEYLDVATDLKSSELKERMAPLYGELCSKYAKAGYASQTLDALVGEKRRLDKRVRAVLLGAFVVNCGDHALEARAIDEEIGFYERGEEPMDLEMAAKLTEKLLNDYLDTLAGAEIWGAQNAGAFQGVGSLAPNFPAVDTVGDSFRLNDYRGQVVMLDFWGFW